MNLGILGSQIWRGQDKIGVANGPIWIRQQNVFSSLDKFFDIIDYGDLVDSGGNLYTYYEELYILAKQILNQTQRSIFLGGDHSIAISTIAAVLENKTDTGIIWFDAHGDINTPDSSPTGNLHGMPLAYLTGLVEEKKGFSWLKTKLDPKKIVFMGVRDLDSGEKNTIAELGIKIISVEDIQKRGGEYAIDRALEYLNCPNIHLSFDIDGIDPQYTLATGTPVDVGVSMKDCLDMLKRLKDLSVVKSMDIVEINPELAIKASDLDNLVRILSSLFGICYRFN